MNEAPVLSLIVWLPVLASAACLLIPSGPTQRVLGVGVSVGCLLLAAIAWSDYSLATDVRIVERVRWIPSVGLEYFLGLDGLNAPLVALNALLGAVALAGSGVRAHSRSYTALLLLAQGAVAGALLALDLALYFVFWEAMLLPIVLLVGIHGGDGRAHAAMKFFLYTTAGSLLMRFSIVSLPYVARYNGAPLVLALSNSQIAAGAQAWIFVGFAVAFAIKMPIFPLHTWLPTLYEAAPLPALVYTTMLVKVGAYGFIRIVLPVLPDASARFAPLMAGLSIAGIIYAGALAATAPNLVRALAYSSIAHLGFVGLGVWSLTGYGVQGAVVQMVNHGVTSAALFLLAVYLLRRTGTLEFSQLGGLAGRWPVLSWLVLFATLSSLGLPGLNNFVGEFLVLLGAYQREPIYALALLGVLLAAVYSIRYYRLIFHGPETPVREYAAEESRDLRPVELWTLAPLVVLIVIIGFYPRPVLSTTETIARAIVAPAASAVESATQTTQLLGRYPWNR
ncbi:MAG: NADH-quinone oxidoreductase subunit M [Chloroflexia bacterium]